MSRTHRFVRLVPILVSLGASGGAARAQPLASAAATMTEADALDVAQRWAALVAEANVPALEKLLDDRYTHIHATALVEKKAQFLDAFRNGSRKYDPIKLEETEARAFGSAAVVTGRFGLKAVSRGRTIEGVNRFTLVVVETPSGQRVVSFQATLLPPQNAR